MRILKMANICLPKELASKFIRALREGVLNPGELANMTSAQRREFFARLLGTEYAPHVNALFESKLLLKNQQTGMINWAKQVAGLKPTVRRDMLARIAKLDKVLTATEHQKFLEDLAAERLGTHVTFEEAAQIAQFSQEVQRLKATADRSKADANKYGAAVVLLENKVAELKLSNSRRSLKEIKEGILKRPVGEVKDQIYTLAGTAKGIGASLDNSALFRQGWRTLFTNPILWARNAAKSFQDIVGQVIRKPSNEDIINGIKAEIRGRENSRNGLYQKMKLDIGVEEEMFPTSLPAKIPLFGRLYAASETAYKGFLYRLRADLADKYVEVAKNSGVNLNDKLEVESIGRLTNSLTGRGNLGKAEAIAGGLNTVFFSPRFIKSQFDFLTLHSTDKMSVFARKQAALNLLKVISGIALVLGTAKAINPDSVELDPTSSDFGKIKIGNTRFDVSGGMGSMVVLAARLIEGQTKSSVSGKVTQLDSGKFGQPTRQDMVVNYFTNKFAPLPGFIRDLAKKKDFDGTDLTPQKRLAKLAPIPLQNAFETLQDPNSAPDLLVIIADGLGISTQTYTPR